MIKQLDIYLTSHTSGNNKVNHITGNLLCKNNVNVYQLFGMNYLLLFFLYMIPIHSNANLLGM